MKELKRLELSLGIEYNECSIAAAELSKNVHELLAYTELCEDRRFVVFENDAESQYDINYLPVSFDFTTQAGRTCRLLLGREIISKAKKQAVYGQPRLFVVTHGNIALPLASFTRRNGSSCDHVQLGDEMYGDDLIVTPEDEHSRFEVIELLRRQLANDPQLYRFQEEIEDAKRSANKDLLRQEIESLAHSQRGYISHKASKEECELQAVVSVLNLPSEIRGPNSIYWRSDRIALLTNITGRQYERAKRQLSGFLDGGPTMQDVIEGDVVGGFSEIGRKFLINHVAKMLGTGSNMANIYQVFKIDEKYDALIGETTRLKERLYRAVNAVAINGSVVLELVRKNTKIAKTSGDVELKLAVDKINATATTVSLKAKPHALDGVGYATVLDGVRIDSQQPIELDEDDIEELLILIDEMAVNGLKKEILPAW